MENRESPKQDLLKSQGLGYTQKGKKLEDAQSSASTFILFGAIGIIALIAMWMGILPLHFETYMKIMYTIVLGAVFLGFTIAGFYYKSKIKTLESETQTEERMTEEIVNYVTTNYPLEKLDRAIESSSSMEQIYFERYERIAAIIKNQYDISDEKYLDYLIEKIYQVYVPQEEM